MHKKFIINDGNLILKQVNYHRDIPVKDSSKTIGGGYFYYDEDQDTLYLYGNSSDYGHVTPEQIKASFSVYLMEEMDICIIHSYEDDVDKITLSSPLTTIIKNKKEKDDTGNC